SFECGTANWGSFTYGLSGWAGNLYRLEGESDAVVSQHGRHSLKIALTPKTLPVFYFDYYDPVRQPVRRVLAANQGWFRVKPGEKLTLSAFLRADAEGVAAQLAANEAPSHLLRKQVTVGKEWQGGGASARPPRHTRPCPSPAGGPSRGPRGPPRRCGWTQCNWSAVTTPRP